MADPDLDPDGLFEQMVAAGHTEFLLSSLDEGIVLTDREERLVNAAVAAGVVGALAVLREDDAAQGDAPTRH